MKDFTPIIGMKSETKPGNGWKGIIEYVGKDYFILRSYRTGEPLLIKPYQYNQFLNFKL